MHFVLIFAVTICIYQIKQTPHSELETNKQTNKQTQTKHLKNGDSRPKNSEKLIANRHSGSLTYSFLVSLETLS